ncbi:hypothetical protein I656_00239 [Geobacillus sp. WSUCF1]|nr:hypothetical protein I656_00239 [Geobacillus sp. WSUCF1]
MHSLCRATWRSRFTSLSLMKNVAVSALCFFTFQTAIPWRTQALINRSIPFPLALTRTLPASVSTHSFFISVPPRYSSI